MAYSIYSLPDTKTVFNHPNVGRMVLSDESNGAGRVSISYSGDMGQQQASATGYIVITKVRVRHGAVSIEVPQNSPADLFLKKWVAYVDTAAPGEFALATLTIQDFASGLMWNCSGVCPQKKPDRQYDQAGGNIQYVLLCAAITET